MGFRPSDTLSVGGYKAVVTSVSPNEITAIAPPAQAGFAGSVDVEVDDLPIFYASTVITGGISYDAGTGDSLTLNTAPANIVPIGAPLPFTVTAVGANGSPAGGVTVTFTLVSGNASLACGSTSCPVSAAGDGVATMNVSALGTGISIVRASLTNGANLEAHFSGGAPGIVTALTPGLSIAAGTSVNWTTQAIVLNNGTPMVGQSVAWQTASGITTVGGKLALTDSGGVATKSLVVGPLNEGQQAASTACVNGTLQCANFTAIGARPEYAYLEAIAGTTQSIGARTTPNQITLRLRDMNGNPMVAGTVTLYQALYAWAPPCPPHGRCAQPALLASQASTATSALDGTVSFAPATLPGVPSNLIGLAVTGSSSTLPIAIEQHP
jgi:hypothetical protein